MFAYRRSGHAHIVGIIDECAVNFETRLHPPVATVGHEIDALTLAEQFGQ